MAKINLDFKCAILWCFPAAFWSGSGRKKDKARARAHERERERELEGKQLEEREREGRRSKKISRRNSRIAPGHRENNRKFVLLLSRHVLYLAGDDTSALGESKARLSTPVGKGFVNLGSVGRNDGRVRGTGRGRGRGGRVDVGADRTTGELGRTKRDYEGRAEKMAGCVGGWGDRRRRARE